MPLPEVEVRRVLSEIAHEEGLELFDVEIPKGTFGVLRVFISNPKGGGKVDSIGVGHCVKVSKRIEASPSYEELCPGQCVLEVSSPGINRKLRRPEHFLGAIGERIKVVFEKQEEPARTVVGTLLSFDGEILHISDEESKKEFKIAFHEVKSSQVEFLF